MKEKFMEPELNIIRFEAVDVITTSDPLNGPLDPDELPPIPFG